MTAIEKVREILKINPTTACIQCLEPINDAKNVGMVDKKTRHFIKEDIKDIVYITLYCVKCTETYYSPQSKLESIIF